MERRPFNIIDYIFIGVATVVTLQFLGSCVSKDYASYQKQRPGAEMIDYVFDTLGGKR